MHHLISYHMARARIAGLRRHAQRDALARAARGAGRRRRAGLRPWAPGRPGAVPRAAPAARPGQAGGAPVR
jgi:hypothetical protein